MDRLIASFPEEVVRLLGMVVPDEIDKKALQVVKNPTFAPQEDALMAYYRQYKAQMIRIFEDNYPQADLPSWVNYDGLELEKLDAMIDTLFTQILDEGLLNASLGDSMMVDFSWDLATALVSDNFSIYDRIGDEMSHLSIKMKIDYLELGG